MPGFLRQTLVLAAVATSHVEDGNVLPLGTNNRQAAVGITQHQHSIRSNGNRELVALSNDIAYAFSQVCTNGIHIAFRICKLLVTEEYNIRIVIIILTDVSQNHIKIFAGLIDDGSQLDHLRSHRFKESIRMFRGEDITIGHDRYQISHLRPVNDVVGPARNHVGRFNLIPGHFKFHRFSGVDVPFLNQAITGHYKEDKKAGQPLHPVNILFPL